MTREPERDDSPTVNIRHILFSVDDHLAVDAEEATDADVEQAIDALMQRCAGLEQVQNALGLDKEATNDQIVEALNAVIENCGELQTRNAEIENEKLANEAQALVAENEDVLPEDIREEVKNEYVEKPENATLRPRLAASSKVI